MSSLEVKQRLRRKEQSFPAGATEFDEALKAIAHTLDDVRLEVEAELAAENLRRQIVDAQPKVSHTEVVAYYRSNIRRYRIPERRYFDIGENFRSAAIARKHIREVKAGKSLPSLHESLLRRPFSEYDGEKRTIIEAIFGAKPHVISEPIELNGLYFLIDITRVVPAHVEPLARVHRAIKSKLVKERQRKAIAAFISGWRRKWTERTDCDSGYVVQKCRQYRGTRTAEGPLAFN